MHDSLFGLYDAMAAIELMDPKMDAGMMCNKSKKIIPFEEMVEKKMIQVDDFTGEELIGIIDDTFSCLVTWLDGHSLAQTVFSNLYLHNPNLICDKTLKAFCVVILKTVDAINDFVMQASVYEEEDFQPKTFSFNLASNVSYSKALTMIKVVEDDLSKQIYKYELLNSAQQSTTSLECLKALLVRLNFTKHFYIFLSNFKKQVGNNQNLIPMKEFVINACHQLSTCDELTKQWMLSIDLGVKPVERSNAQVDHSQPDYPTILGFEPLVNQRLLPPSFPRYTMVKARPDTVNYLKMFLFRLRRLFCITECAKFGGVIKFFNDFSKMTPSCVVSRSMLQLFYLPPSGLVFGEAPFAKIIKDSCKQFIRPPILSGELTVDANTKEIVEGFFNRCLIPFKSVIQTYGNNRARQREKIAIVLKDFGCVMEESVTLDRYLSSKLNHSFFGFLQFWVLFYKLSLMSQYLLSGFELELYSLHEYPYMFMELDYIWDYITLLLKRAAEICQQPDVYIKSASTNLNKNRKKQGKSKCKQQNNLHEQEILYYKGISHLAGAFQRIFLAFSIEGKLIQPTQNLNTEKIRYNHRFSPLIQFEGGLLSYEKYKERFDYFKKSDTSQLSQLYVESCTLLTQARTHFEAIKEASLQEEVRISLTGCTFPHA